ncbi:MAG: DUF5691 domain-containing protein [Chitinophagaceae bacterium]
MQPWNDIINTALLGTDKRKPDAMQLTGQLAEAAASIQQNTTDKEEQFLQLAAVLFNYRQCGVMPLHKEGVGIAKAAPEEKKYCSPVAMQLLKDILDADNDALFQLWLQQCAAKQFIVTPEMVPRLFNEARLQKKLQTLIASCCGKRGEWLSRLNPDWNFSAGSDEELWQTGTPEQRRSILHQLRQSDPQKALAWLQQTWAQEDANEKTELLQLLTANIGEADVPFLESLAGEKSKKVKDTVLKLLKQVPSSTVVKQYEDVLAQSVRIKKEKSFLGMVKHTSVHFQLPAAFDESIFKTGIEKLSNNKSFSDEEYIIFQLIQSVPPRFWEAHLQSEPEGIIGMFQKDKNIKKFLLGLIIALVNFKDTRWAIAFMQHSEVFYIDILPLLPVQQQEFYSKKFIEQNPNDVIDRQLMRNDEWSTELTKLIFIHTAKNIYQYNRSFYNNHVLRFPAAIASQLEQCAPPEEHLRNSWSNMSEHIAKLISLKTQTGKAFNE